MAHIHREKKAKAQHTRSTFKKEIETNYIYHWLLEKKAKSLPFFYQNSIKIKFYTDITLQGTTQNT